MNLSLGFSVDLDNGTVSTNILPGTDLSWNPTTGLATNGTSGLTITGTNFGALTPVQVSFFPFTMNQIPVPLIPATFPPSFPFIGHDEVVFGMRTTEGRFAKLRAWRSLLEAGELHLEWVTYDTPNSATRYCCAMVGD